MHYSMVKPHCSNFWVITAKFLGVLIVRKFTVTYLNIVDYMSPQQGLGRVNPLLVISVLSHLNVPSVRPSGG